MPRQSRNIVTEALPRPPHPQSPKGDKVPRPPHKPYRFHDWAAI